MGSNPTSKRGRRLKPRKLKASVETLKSSSHKKIEKLAKARNNFVHSVDQFQMHYGYCCVIHLLHRHFDIEAEASLNAREGKLMNSGVCLSYREDPHDKKGNLFWTTILIQHPSQYQLLVSRDKEQVILYLIRERDRGKHIGTTKFKPKIARKRKA